MAIQIIDTDTNETIAIVPVIGSIQTIRPSVWVDLIETFLADERKKAYQGALNNSEAPQPKKEEV